MRRILFVHTGTLCAAVANFPLVCDLRDAASEMEVHWIIDEAHARLVSLHPGITRTFPVAPQRWWRGCYKTSVWREVAALRDALRPCAYDAIITDQRDWSGRLLSAFAKGRSILLQQPKSRGALTHNREHVARILQYTPRPEPRYGLAPRLELIESSDWFASLRSRAYVVFLHATHGRAHPWPDHRWSKLGALLVGKGLCVVLPWHDPDSHDRSMRLGSLIPRCVVPPRLPLDQMAALLKGAAAVACADIEQLCLAQAVGIRTRRIDAGITVAQAFASMTQVLETD